MAKINFILMQTFPYFTSEIKYTGDYKKHVNKIAYAASDYRNNH